MIRTPVVFIGPRLELRARSLAQQILLVQDLQRWLRHPQGQERGEAIQRHVEALPALRRKLNHVHAMLAYQQRARTP